MRQGADELVEHLRHARLVRERADQLHVRVRRRRVALQDLDQSVARDRLRERIIAPGGDAQLAITVHRVRREGDDRPGVASLPQQRGGLVAVELGHLHVHQDELTHHRLSEEAGATPMRVNPAGLRDSPGRSGVPTEIAYRGLCQLIQPNLEDLH